MVISDQYQDYMMRNYCEDSVRRLSRISKFRDSSEHDRVGLLSGMKTKSRQHLGVQIRI